jgi:hypothetical protein
MTDLHLVASNSAAGTLRFATRKLALQGEVFCIMDELSLGPLSDGRERVDFWRSLMAPGYSDQPLPAEWNDAFAPWHELRRRVADDKPQRLLVWTSGSGADYVFLRMACHWLLAGDVALWRVPVPQKDGFHAVAVHTPEALTSFAPTAIVLSPTQIAAMAQEYDDIAKRPELLRECDAQGRLLFNSIAAHDDFILDFCPAEWAPAARVVGQAMGGSDPRNPLGDMFVASRLQHLIATGLVEADGPRTTLRNYRVRRRIARPATP